MAGRTTTVAPTMGIGFEVQAIAAAVTGGAALTGGRGRAFGALLGATVLVATTNAINLSGVSSSWQSVVTGTMLLLAVLLDGGGHQVPPVALRLPVLHLLVVRQRLVEEQAEVETAAPTQHLGDDEAGHLPALGGGQRGPFGRPAQLRQSQRCCSPRQSRHLRPRPHCSTCRPRRCSPQHLRRRSRCCCSRACLPPAH